MKVYRLRSPTFLCPNTLFSLAAPGEQGSEWDSGTLHKIPLPTSRAAMLLTLDTHLYIALTVRASDWGGRTIHTQFGQEPHYLE